MLAESMLVERFVRQRLIGELFPDPVAAVGWFGAVQSQDFAGALWGVGQRCRNGDEASIRRLFDEGAILRTHVLRPTWHFVAPADLRWMLALTAPRVHAVNGPYYRRYDLDANIEGLRLALIVMWCELEALVCSGAMRGKQHTYALVEERVVEAPERDADEAPWRAR